MISSNNDEDVFCYGDTIIVGFKFFKRQKSYYCYYAGYNLSTHTLMAEDIKTRRTIMFDCDVSKFDLTSFVRMKIIKVILTEKYKRISRKNYRTEFEN
jgi:uncharacterized CHY-type Zn-finger protein